VLLREGVTVMENYQLKWLNGAKRSPLLLNQRCLDDKMIKRRLLGFFSPKRGPLTSFTSIPLLV